MTGKRELAPDPTAIGDVSSPPFVRLPNPSTLFSVRALRLRQLAQTNPLAPYLTFLADLADAQARVQADLPPSGAPDAEAITRAREFGMPILDREFTARDPELDAIFTQLFDDTGTLDMPASAVAALSNAALAQTEQRGDMIAAVYAGLLPPDAVAEHIYIWHGLQLYFSRKAAVLEPRTVRPIADGVCPVCGSQPSGSMVVGWAGAHGARFCACSLCNVMWHYVRIKCICCGSTKGIGYKEVEGGEGAIKAETCDECRRWTKIIYHQTSPDAEPVADDVASLGIDILMRGEPYSRGGFAPLLAGL